MAEELTFPDFRDQVLAIVLTEDEDDFTVLEKTRFELQGGRVFLIGTVPEGVTEDDWCAGTTCAVAWEHVIAYYLFASVEEYLEMIDEE